MSGMVLVALFSLGYFAGCWATLAVVRARREDG
jgi:hypothetical protein